MVGGTVEELLQVESGLAMAILVRGVLEDQHRCVAINIKGVHKIAKGDTIWWQGANAYWTPADKSREDVQLRRIGYTYTEKSFRAMQRLHQ